MTAADDDVALVDTLPVPTTVFELTQIARPAGPFSQTRRLAPIERSVFVLRATVARVISEDDRDLHLVLRDLDQANATMVAEIPDPSCSANSRYRPQYEAARRALRGLPRDGLVEIVGIGFFDFLHEQSGMARNGLEIHPVISLRVIAR